MMKAVTAAAMCFVLLLPFMRADACTELYAGAAVTEDGKIWFGRSEDDDEVDYSKQFYVSPAGAHKAGEEYEGYYGFRWTFTHDTYSYTALQDDCGVWEYPDGSGMYTPLYQSAGTNEKGLSLTATETLRPSEKAVSSDPFAEKGIEEAEIATILLGEAASARDAVELLAGIYETVGACGAGGVLVADKEESWYIENLSGTQYVAVKLNDEILTIEPDIAIIGRIDLDDTDNIIASDGVIAAAKAAGTFVGDEAENVIDYASSFEANRPDPSRSAFARLLDGLKKLNDAYDYTVDSIQPEDYSISNIGENGEIVPPYANLKADRLLSRQDIFELYATPVIGGTFNMETHLFSIDSSSDTDTSIVEWVAMGDARYTVFVPYYPLLTTDVHDSYKVGAACVKTEDGTFTHPDNWADSFCWNFKMLSRAAEENDENVLRITQRLREAQEEILDDWDNLVAEVADAKDREAAATEGSMVLADKAYKAARELLSEIGEPAEPDNTGAVYYTNSR